MWPLILCGRRNSFRASRVIFTCFSTLQFSSPSSSNGKEFLHLRESSSRAFRRSNSHFKQLQGFSSATFNAPYAPKSPLKVPQSPLNAPLPPGFTLKGWVTYWIERQCTICPQVPPKGSPVPPKCPLVPRFYPKRLSNILRILWFRGECDPLLGANVTPVPGEWVAFFFLGKLGWTETKVWTFSRSIGVYDLPSLANSMDSIFSFVKWNSCGENGYGYISKINHGLYQPLHHFPNKKWP